MISSLWASEPVAVVAFVGVVADALLALAIAFGAPITPDQKLALTTFATIVVTGVSALIARKAVTPVAKVAALVAGSTAQVAMPLNDRITFLQQERDDLTTQLNKLAADAGATPMTASLPPAA